jgi:AcrR family transcriptional regulator
MRARLTRAEQREQTRLRLLDATVGVIRQRGWADASIDAIAELAGYTRGAFYFHFASKEEAALEAAEHYAGPAFDAFSRQVVEASSDAEVIALLTGLIQPDDEAARSSFARAQVIAGIFRDPQLGPRAIALQRRGEVVLGEALTNLCTRRGRPAPMPVAELGALFAALLDGLTARRAIDPEPDAATLMRRAIDLLIESSDA